MNDYEQRQEARRQRLQAAAEKQTREAETRLDRAHTIAGMIPFGQPILVGHHSERQHRRDLARIDTDMRKGLDARAAAEDLRHRADAVGTGGISSDDPQAIEKLTAELAKLEALHETMKAANKLVKRQDRTGLVALGFSEARIDDLFTPDFAGRLGFPSYAITNNGANIRRIKARIEHLKRLPAAQEAFAPLAGDGWRIWEEGNRILIAFDERQPRERAAQLKSYGFKWSPTRTAWVRQFSQAAIYWAKQIVQEG